MPTLKAVVSGSFRRHMADIQDTVHTLVEMGVEVLSPADPRVVDEFGEFLFVASDRLRSIRGVQSRHLLALHEADFLWMVNPDGYIGQSASMELGFAVAIGKPIFSDTAPNDLTLRQYVTTVSALGEVPRALTAKQRSATGSILVDPIHGAEELHRAADAMRHQLTAPPGTVAEEDLLATFARTRSLIDLP